MFCAGQGVNHQTGFFALTLHSVSHSSSRSLRIRLENLPVFSKLTGCQIVYGIEDYKCHSNICLITMHDRGKIRYITQVGTGNYNEKTNTMYTDLSVMTASDAIGEDATMFFRNMLVNNLAGDYRELLVAPSSIKPALCAMIDEQIAKGADGYICIKVNSVTERKIIDKLAQASQAGVEGQRLMFSLAILINSLAANGR